MQASELSNQLAPFAALLNKNALSMTYKALKLAPNYVRGCAAYGAAQLKIATGLQSEIYVDGTDFLQILRSLPSADFEMQAAEGALLWRCGAARGQLALLGEQLDIAPPPWPENLTPRAVPQGFAKAFEFGALGCGSVALLSVGLYGITLANSAAGVYAYSSDNVTIATLRVCDPLPGPERAYISPDVIRLVGALRGQLSVALDDSSLYLATPNTKCTVRQVPELKFNLPEVVKPFASHETEVALDRNIIAAFIKRAEALAEERSKTLVAISVSEGTVRLTFAEGKSSSEEYYLAEGGPKFAVAPISVDSVRLAKALSKASHVVFDHTARGALVLRGTDEFSYIISGRAPEAK